MPAVTTMAFITRCWRNACLDGRVWVWCVFWGLGLCVAPRPVQAQANASEVTQLQVARVSDGVYLSATWGFELPFAVEDALSKGIAMYFVTEAELYRDRWYWTDKRVARAVRTVRLSFQPLTRRWRVQVSGGGQGGNDPELTLGQNFDALPEALSAVQRISRWKVAETSDVDAGVKHTLSLSFRLDTGRLPRPFQIGAVGQSDWTLVAKRSQPLLLEAER